MSNHTRVSAVSNADLTGRRWKNPARSVSQLAEPDDVYPELAPEGMAFKILDDDERPALQFRYQSEAQAMANLLDVEIVYGSAVEGMPYSDRK